MTAARTPPDLDPSAEPLDRGGNRQINAAIHRIAITRVRCDQRTKAYIERKTAEGKTTRDAIRCLKRHIIREIWQLLRAHPDQDDSLSPTDFLTYGMKIPVAEPW